MVDGRYMNELEGVQVAFERIYGEDTSTKVVYVKSAQKLTDDQ
jgi:F0F1-type ATP synthase delta subunit